MKFGNRSITALALLLSFNCFYYFTCHAATIYDYDHVDTWNTKFSGKNQNCDGTKQSPIALETMYCTHYANYEMNVSTNPCCVILDYDAALMINLGCCT